MENSGQTTRASDEPIAALMKQLTEQSATLARQEVELAKTELQQKGKQVGLGAGMFGGSGIFGLYALGALTACAILALATAVDAWLAALIVTVVWAAIAGVLALIGKNRVQQGSPPVPEQTIDSVREDVQWTKQHAQAGRRK